MTSQHTRENYSGCSIQDLLHADTKREADAFLLWRFEGEFHVHPQNQSKLRLFTPPRDLPFVSKKEKTACTAKHQETQNTTEPAPKFTNLHSTEDDFPTLLMTGFVAVFESHHVFLKAATSLIEYNVISSVAVRVSAGRVSPNG